MKYEIDARYVWYNGGKQIVLMYFIQGVPFSFDEIDDWLTEPKLIELADKEKRYSVEEVYEASNYLIQEQCHPLLFDVELTNPEILPTD
jgi:hypothetical protein